LVIIHASIVALQSAKTSISCAVAKISLASLEPHLLQQLALEHVIDAHQLVALGQE
jgi:hypothetical protein